jgi:soluble lytic murein transglycosylase-like protein
MSRVSVFSSGRAVLAAAALVAVPASASAGVPHVVGQGESLWSIAVANGFTTRALAAANGLSPDAHVILGSTITIPTVAEARAALGRLAASPAPPSPPAASAPAPIGAYTVRPGDTLSELALRSGVPMRQMAYMNGLDPAKPLLIGTVLKLPTGSPARPAAPAPAAPRVVPVAPVPTAGRVTAAEIAPVALRNGVPPSLASAIAWQESGFNNAVVSPANARGVMQILPGTWDWVQRYLARRPLNPALPIDNVAAGVLFLGHLLRETGGNHGLAAAGYYQGLASVRRRGLLPDTRRYVANVLALRGRFGGP